MQSEFRNAAKSQLEGEYETPNVGKIDRVISALGGAGLIVYGLMKPSKAKTALSLLTGGALIYRGATGRSRVYKALGIGSAGKGTPATSVAAETGIRVEKSIIIDRPASELYRFWRNLENLPNFMQHLDSVRMLDNRNSHWRVKGPAGMEIEWYAEIINDVPNERIGWKSLDSADVDHAGSVHFQPIDENRTQVDVTMKYNPPAGKIGAAFAKLFGEDPKTQVAEDLQTFKAHMETQKFSSSNEELNPFN
ncbi:MAG TPA: SRPBCC family protein [Acidobacteriota bacterium]|nr:SRPBCC family protein [Acidobacteriota bacterium]